MSDDGVLRVDARIAAVRIDGEHPEVVLRTDLKTLRELAQLVGRDCTIALVTRREPAGA